MDTVQRRTFQYFWEGGEPYSGMARERYHIDNVSVSYTHLYGIGFAIASAFAEQGATICFNDINRELVDKGLASNAEKGIKAHGYVCDDTDEPAVQAMVATIAKEVGTIDILVNNAVIIRRVPDVYKRQVQ